MMRNKRLRPSTENAEVNMTPMLDIVFILLIFFIVTATFLDEKGFDLTPPPPSPEKQQRNIPAIQIYLDESNLIRMDGRYVDIGALRANIERRKAQQPDISVLVQAHAEAKSRFVIKTIDIAKSANITNISLVKSAE